MKPERDDELTISVRHEVDEAPESVRALYRGIYALTLSHRHEIRFIPGLGLGLASPSPGLALPADFDAIDSVEEARLVALATSRFAVMPDDARAGTQARCSAVRWNDGSAHRAPLVFYVTHERFGRYRDELALLSGRFSGIHDAVRAADLRQYAVVAFACDRVLPELA